MSRSGAEAGILGKDIGNKCLYKYLLLYVIDDSMPCENPYASVHRRKWVRFKIDIWLSIYELIHCRPGRVE